MGVPLDTCARHAWHCLLDLQSQGLNSFIQNESRAPHSDTPLQPHTPFAPHSSRVAKMAAHSYNFAAFELRTHNTVSSPLSPPLSSCYCTHRGCQATL